MVEQHTVNFTSLIPNHMQYSQQFIKSSIFFKDVTGIRHIYSLKTQFTITHSKMENIARQLYNKSPRVKKLTKQIKSKVKVDASASVSQKNQSYMSQMTDFVNDL